jgi:hypothetical protein
MVILPHHSIKPREPQSQEEERVYLYEKGLALLEDVRS